MAQGNAHSNPFLIAALGASADGLEAFERFFEHVPAETGIAFVIIQPLAPDHANALPELLARYTLMAVEQVRDRAKIAPNMVYIIPPNATCRVQSLIVKAAAGQTSRHASTSWRNAAPVYGAFRFATMVSVSKRSTWRKSLRLLNAFTETSIPAAVLAWRFAKHWWSVMEAELGGIRIWAAIDVPLYDPCVRW